MTSETKTVPTKTSDITDEILAEATTAQDNGPINKESSTGNTEGTTTYLAPILLGVFFFIIWSLSSQRRL